ncbi:hypothetical protein [Paenibacillus sp. Marseille-P2973]|nr:hypothetical protein [Paenibacillus sp. Marseille-P2973]
MGLSNKAIGTILALIVGFGLAAAIVYVFLNFPDRIQQFAPMFN